MYIVVLFLEEHLSPTLLVPLGLQMPIANQSWGSISKNKKIVLKTYMEEQMHVTGIPNVRIQYRNQIKKLTLVMIAGDEPSLFSQNGLNHITLNWWNALAVRATWLGALHMLMHRHQELFSEGLGRVIGKELDRLKSNKASWRKSVAATGPHRSWLLWRTILNHFWCYNYIFVKAFTTVNLLKYMHL